MFTKAVVLSKTDFGILASDIADMFVGDYENEIRSGRVTEKDARNYFASYFEELLNSEGVDEMVAFIGERREAVEIQDGNSFVAYVLEDLGVKNLLDYVRDWLG
jgi:hypothetical protein